MAVLIVGGVGAAIYLKHDNRRQEDGGRGGMMGGGGRGGRGGEAAFNANAEFLGPEYAEPDQLNATEKLNAAAKLNKVIATPTLNATTAKLALDGDGYVAVDDYRKSQVAAGGGGGGGGGGVNRESMYDVGAGSGGGGYDVGAGAGGGGVGGAGERVKLVSVTMSKRVGKKQQGSVYLGFGGGEDNVETVL